MQWTYAKPRASLTYGPLHPLFAVYFLYGFGFALYSLWQNIRTASRVRSLQLRYLLLGLLIGGAGAITTNLFIPLFAKTSRYSLLGPYFSLILAAFFAHGIIRHRLMDIRLVIRNGVVYACAVVAAGAAFIGLAAILNAVAGYPDKRLHLTAALAIALIMAILFHPLKDAIQFSINRYLYRERYDYDRTVRGASRRLSTILDFDSLLRSLAGVVGNTFRADTVAVYLRNDLNNTYSLAFFVSARGSSVEPPNADLVMDSDLPRYLKKADAIVREEAVLRLKNSLQRSAAEQLRQLNGDVAVPMSDERGLFGFVAIGPKLSGDPYFTDDIDLLSTLVSQTSIALKNAQLYREVVLINEYVNNILTTMESAVVAVDADGRVTLFNAAAHRLTGADAATIRGRSFKELPPPIVTLIDATLKDRDPRVQVETAIYGAAGRLTPIICSTAPLTDRSNTAALGAVAVFSDLTRLKQLEEEKRHAEQFAAIGALASGIAHEIKNPLVAIRTFAELLPERFSEADFRNDFAQVVTREIERIDGLVARLRGLAGKPTRSLSLVDLRTPIDETLALLRAQFEQRHVTVKIDYPKSLPRIEADSGQLKQLFLNVFINALEAMGDTGVLAVRVSKPADKKLAVAISDTGPGIEPGLLDKIFDPFVTTKESGSGLGLSICRTIADAHHATVTATNNDSTGATIIIEFPIPGGSLTRVGERHADNGTI